MASVIGHSKLSEEVVPRTVKNAKTESCFTNHSLCMMLKLMRQITRIAGKFLMWCKFSLVFAPMM